MDPEIGKVAQQVTEKVAESLAPSLIKKVLSWTSGKKSTESKTREVKNRGSWERRSASKDRRVSSISQRLRTGFSLEYFRKTGAGKFDVLVLTLKTRQDLFVALVAEASRYEFSDRTSGLVVAPAFIIETALEVNWPNWSHRPEKQNKAVLLLEEIAEHLLMKYNVKKIDRRKQQRRQVLPVTASGRAV